MAQGYQWSAWDYAEVSSVDVDATAVANGATLTTDEILLSGYACAEVSIASTEDNTGSTSSTNYCYVLGVGGDGTYQTAADNPQIGAAFTQTQNSTDRPRFRVSGASFGTFKTLYDNNCGQEVAVTIRYRRATFDNGT